MLSTFLAGAQTDPDGFDPSEPHDWLTWFVGLPLRVILIIGIGAVALGLLRRVIRGVTEHIAAGTPTRAGARLRGLGRTEVGSAIMRATPIANPLATARRAARARTIGSVLRSAANILIGTTVVLMVLAELGMNIGPFLASAGIAGVALGFGAQSLVKDFLSGTFMLLEDQYGVGDVVDFGEVTGTVEEVALRVTKVRDLDGTAWYVRNGEILRTGNMSQEWARATVDVRVAYFADVDAVRSALLQAAQRVADDPMIGSYLMEPAEVVGVEDLTAEALRLKVWVKTQPAMQWEVARALRVSVRDVLAEAGIPLAGAQQVVVLDQSPARADAQENPVDGADVPRDAAAAAAGIAHRDAQDQENKGS
ncbi:mechanosensitive ion channel family protein [Cellulosimicrobium arenosum]|uniref:Mechanosensitive ion channel family protein n=1 Tax=Cellulosimicrobium arenosum TaxID=2708133 RepID=A0A927J292_9MICO|nr:mechanosensitive ion channel family protein [Cellulosimicrobium arenosum]MBD8080601.1 mechanosensitive ion channel family protein [Cellulosimicrobium arenosum]